MKYLDFDIEIGSGDGNTYPLVIRSAAGEIKETMRFPFDELALKFQLQALENAVLKSGQTHRKVLSDEAQAAQDFGRQLFEALLPGEARSLFSVSRNKATQEHLLGVRIRLRINAPELAALPWEYLYDNSAGEYLSLLKGSPIVRYPEMPLPIEPLQVTLPLRILGMIASPVDQDRLDVEHEKRRMEEALQEPIARGEVELVWIEGQTWEHLQEAMWRGPWHIFHFIGHGGFDKSSDEGLIALADEHGKTRLLGANDLGLLLMNQGSVRLALLNACQGAKSGGRDAFSSTAATLARRGIPAVLAMQEDISDRAAVQLTRTFYRALATGMPVDEALAHARAAIRVGLHNSLEWGTPVLYLRAPDGVLFTLSGTPKPAVPKSEPAQPPSQPATPGGFPNAQRAASSQAPGWGAPAQPGYPPSYNAPQPGYAAFTAPPSYEAPRPVVSPFNTPAPTLVGASLSTPASGPTANEPTKPERKKEEPKPLPAPKNQYDMMRLDKLRAKASSVGTAEVFLLGGVGTLVGVMTQSWPFAVGTAVALAILAYVLGYRKLLSWLPFGIIAVASAAVVVALTFYVTSLPYDHQQISQFWFGIQRALTLRHQVIAGAGVGALASLCGFYVFDSSRKDSFETNFYTGAVFIGIVCGSLVWLIVSALGSIFNWGFGFGYGWLTGFLGGYLVTAIAGVGLITLLLVWKRTHGAWGLHDAARLRLEERFGDTLDQDLQAAVNQADEAAITALLPHIAKDSPEDLRALLKQGSTRSQQPASAQEAAQKPQDPAKNQPGKPEPPVPPSASPPSASQPQAARQEPQRSAHQQAGRTEAQVTPAAPQAEEIVPPQKTFNQWFNEGMGYVSAGRNEEALTAYDNALQLDPDNATLWRNKGITLDDIKFYDQVLAAYDRALQLDPNDARTWNSKGYTLYTLKRYQEALAAYDRALQLDPNFVPAWINKGLALGSLKPYKEELSAYERVIELAPNNVWAWRNKGVALFALKRQKEALAAIDHALQLAPYNAAIWIQKGWALLALKRWEEARGFFEQAKTIDPQNAEAQAGLAYAYLGQKRNSDARYHAKQALQLDPRNASALEVVEAVQAIEANEEARIKYLEFRDIRF